MTCRDCGAIMQPVFVAHVVEGRACPCGTRATENLGQGHELTRHGGVFEAQFHALATDHAHRL